MKEKLKLFAKKIEVDKAVLYGVSGRIWTTLAGPISALLIASNFSLPLQGFYFTFSSLLALQIFAELGLGAVIQQFASHEWAKLDIDNNGRIIGEKNALSRLCSLFNLALKWFLFGSLITSLGLLFGGYYFFSTSHNYNINWQAPWICLSILTGINLFFVPFWSMLEGCNQVKTLYAFRFFQGILANIIIWTSILCGVGLWVLIMGSIFSFFCAVLFIRVKYWNFFKELIFTKAVGNIISWRKDLLPMQLRIAISWISGYFAFSFFTPLLFKFQGPDIAGKFGMTWTIIGAIGGIASTWLQPKVPYFAILVSKLNYFELDKLFFKIVKLVFSIMTLLSFLFWGLIYILPILNIKIASYLSLRLLPPLPVAILLIAQTLMISSTPFSSYLRAHKKEPLMFISLIQGILVGISTYCFSKYTNVLGVTLGYLLVVIITIPVCIRIWYNFRKQQIDLL